ncbi:hypothetical protein LC087_01755 [Bacillus carboniphilus]|uniref:SipL SPOCS domain-containing protein n=1 Tax=Bacillus carboniphilus TaxID=86663 RepID=A0ABY9JUB2_9BACI|nr:hypothetical protein [Bacillus carboniphilus]WLR42970.1 hypothetical protein LC087_01755 [Bacillus carboniphilus]
MSHHDRHKVCIRVPKVYDWVNRQVDIPLISINKLSELGFDCQGVTGSATGCPEDPCEIFHYIDFEVKCFLTDSLGNPVDPSKPGALTVVEIVQPEGRQEVSVTLPNGKTIILEKVKVLVKGFVVVEICDLFGNKLCISDPISFATAQTFFLCAPNGTNVNAEITFFECDASLICSDDTFQQVDISITLCLDVQMEANVKLEIEARFCKPRSEIDTVGLCPVEGFPPQCPELFPPNTHC